MKKYSFITILSLLNKTLLALALVCFLSACDSKIYDYEENCDPTEQPDDPNPDNPDKPKPDDPNPGPVQPSIVKIYVRSNPGSGGLSQVTEVDNPDNNAYTEEGIYVGIEVKPNGSYTLTAEETNPDYRFVRWHDDTNNGDLTEGKMVIENIPATAETRYTAIFAKIAGPNDPDDPVNPEDPKPVYLVEYVFEKNMQFVDAFSQRVNSVDLYVFTTSGSFVNRYHAEGMALKEKDYRMELTDLPAGSYELIAWCGLTNNSGHFTVPADGQISQRHQVAATMATLTDGGTLYQDQNLNALFHGRLETATYTTEPVEQVYTVSLTKDTNNINLSLQHKEGLEFEKDRFVVAMVDNNQEMRFDNSVPTENPNVEYRPYRTVIGTVSTNNAKSTLSTRASGSTTVGNFLQVELSTARLMTSHNPVITVTDSETDKMIFSIPLVKWALQLRSVNYKTMEEQEYLDREDNFNLMLWLDNDDNGWFGAQILINDWHVIDDESDLK